jgi:hypothetical protein
MVKPSNKRRPSNGTNGKEESPRCGEKTKQPKVLDTKTAATKAGQQTKLAFSAKGTNDKNGPTTTNEAESGTTVRQQKLSFAEAVQGTQKTNKAPTTPNGPSTTAFAITPEDPTLRNKFFPENPPASFPPPRATTQNNNKTNTTPTKKNQQKEKLADNMSTDIEDKKPAARTLKKPPPSNPTTPDPKQSHPPPPNSDTDDDLPQPVSTPKTKRKSSNTRTTKSTEPEASSTKENERPQHAIRYNGLIETPPSEKPFDDFVIILKAYFQVIQDVLGKEVYIAAWDTEQGKSFPPLKKPSKLPTSRESLGIYLGTYINPKTEGSKVYLNLRLMAYTSHPVPLEKFGMELADQFKASTCSMSIHRQPRPCQAAKADCLGWLMYSCKSMNSATFIPAVKEILKIPDDVEIGIQYRTISNETGRKPPFNRDDPPAAAIHLDIDERFSLVYQARAASLWRKNSKKRLPNGVQLRLVPCFTSATGKSMTDTQRSDAQTLTERQYYFLKEHLKTLPPYFFISQLDTPLSDEPGAMTLRRAMMARAPKNQPSNRLIHNVDASWNQPSKHTITTVVGKEIEAQRFLVNMIPELLHHYGEGATKWFTSSGLIVYKDVKWNPEKGTTTSSQEKASAGMVKEDLWDLNDKWEALKLKKGQATSRPNENDLDQTTPTPETEQAPTQAHTRQAGDKSIASFGDAYNREKDADDAQAEATRKQEEAAKLPDLTGTQFVFNPEQVERDRHKMLNGPQSTGFSMSTAAKTTDSVRLKYKEAVEEIRALQLW